VLDVFYLLGMLIIPDVFLYIMEFISVHVCRGDVYNQSQLGFFGIDIA